MPVLRTPTAVPCPRCPAPRGAGTPPHAVHPLSGVCQRLCTPEQCPQRALPTPGSAVTQKTRVNEHFLVRANERRAVRVPLPLGGHALRGRDPREGDPTIAAPTCWHRVRQRMPRAEAGCGARCPWRPAVGPPSHRASVPRRERTRPHLAQECARPSRGTKRPQCAGPRSCIPTDQTHMGAINLPLLQLPP